MTPETLQLIFNQYAITIMFVWGLACKYVPFLKSIPNVTIPWVNAIGYILTALAGASIPVAHAALLGDSTGVAIKPVIMYVPTMLGIIIGGFANAVWARQLYEGFARPIFEKWLGKKVS
jgi:hypothetical protein